MSESKQTVIYHNGDHALRNGSYCAVKGDKVHQYMNGDYMGTIPSVPKFQTETCDVKTANKLLPKCCRQR